MNAQLWGVKWKFERSEVGCAAGRNDGRKRRNGRNGRNGKNGRHGRNGKLAERWLKIPSWVRRIAGSSLDLAEALGPGTLGDMGFDFSVSHGERRGLGRSQGPRFRRTKRKGVSFASDGVFPRARPMRTIASTLLSVVAGLCYAAEEPRHTYVPKDGYVPTEDAAIKIAVAVWEPIYGVAKIAGEKPLHAKLSNGVWTVEGSLPKGRVGGVALAEISKVDGRILRVSHGK